MVVANHLSLLDPVVVGLAVRRPVRFVALDQLWGVSRILDAILWLFDPIPIPRDGRKAFGAMSKALRHLRSGRSLALFPEGRRVRPREPRVVHAGAAWLSIRSGVAVVPVAVWGSQEAMPVDSMKIRRARIRVAVGESVRPADFARFPDPVAAFSQAVGDALDHEVRRMSELP